jgi:hypothetical protein
MGTLSPQMHKMERKEQQLMFKHIIRLALPLVVLVLIALYLVLSPVLATHAAAPHVSVQHVSESHNFASSQNNIPLFMRWRP